MAVIEEWRPITGYNNSYEVSSLGRVKSLARPRKKIIKVNMLREKILSSSIGRREYPAVNLWLDSRRVIAYIHRLVAEAFIPNPNGYSIINHKNGIKTDYSIENLEWCTIAYNNAHALSSGLRKRKYTYDDRQRDEIIQKIDNGISYMRLKKEYRLSYTIYKRVKISKEF
jgi:hypothetical protein